MHINSIFLDSFCSCSDYWWWQQISFSTDYVFWLWMKCWQLGMPNTRMICDVWGVSVAQSEHSWGVWWIDIDLIIAHFTLLLGETIDTNCLSHALCGKGPWTPGCSQEAMFPLPVSWTASPPNRHLPLQAQWIEIPILMVGDPSDVTNTIFRVMLRKSVTLLNNSFEWKNLTAHGLLLDSWVLKLNIFMSVLWFSCVISKEMGWAVWQGYALKDWYGII